jgi:hypothetical protein
MKNAKQKFLYKKCFIRLRYSQYKCEWYRGFIEYVHDGKEKCTVRLMDRGNTKECYFTDVFPYKRNDLEKLGFNKDFLNLNYLAIRCVLYKQHKSSQAFDFNQSFEEEFNHLIDTPEIRFKLVEQVMMPKNIKCWVVNLYKKDGKIY